MAGGAGVALYMNFMHLVYFVDDKLGGVTSLNYNLVSHAPDIVKQTVVHIHQKEWAMTKANIRFKQAKEIFFNFSRVQHGYDTLKQLHKIIPAHTDALVLNYENEMAMLDHYPSKHTVFQLVHDDYNVRLAKKYGHVVDAFICHNSKVFDRLQQMFPTRLNDIFYKPHGVKIPTDYRIIKEDTKPLRLLFLGRMAAPKGIFDLPVIDGMLREKGIHANWTCIGNGPELDAFKQSWSKDAEVRFYAPATNEEVVKICTQQDVFVLPSKFEGSPVSLLETMSVGLVPVITGLPGSIQEIVSRDIGFTVEMDNNAGFAMAIEQLHHDRKLLNKLSEACRAKVIATFNVTETARAYHDIFLNWRDLYRPKQIKKTRIGARLDHPFMPRRVTRLIRRFIS